MEGQAKGLVLSVLPPGEGTLASTLRGVPYTTNLKQIQQYAYNIEGLSVSAPKRWPASKRAPSSAPPNAPYGQQCTSVEC